LYVSLPNYRYYTSKESGVVNQSKGYIENLVTVSSIEPERKNFYIDGKLHSAFRLGYYSLLTSADVLAPIMAEIPMDLLVVQNSKSMH